MRLLWVVGFLALFVATWGIACQSAGQSCAQRTTDAQNATIAAESQAEADLSCATDSDCVLASNSSVCWNSCGVVLNQAGAAQLASAIAQINGTTCATFTADGCEPNPAPPCGAFGAYCVAGQCKGGGPRAEDAGTDAGAVTDASSDGASE